MADRLVIILWMCPNNQSYKCVPVVRKGTLRAVMLGQT